MDMREHEKTQTTLKLLSEFAKREKILSACVGIHGDGRPKVAVTTGNRPGMSPSLSFQYALAKIVFLPSLPVRMHLPVDVSDKGMQRGVAPPVSSFMRRSSSGVPAK